MPRWLERTIGAISPEAALRRERARLQMAKAAHVKALYEGATYSRRAAGWRAPLTDANAETRIALTRLRSVARDMVRNNPYAARGKTSIAHNTIGSGITPTVRAATPSRTKAVGQLLRQHFESTDIDADGRHNIYGLQNLAMGAIVESGEVLIRKRARRLTDGYTFPLQLQVLEADYLDTYVDGPLTNGNYAVQGVEFNLLGQRVAYYLYDRHPGSLTPGMMGSTRGQRVSADFVAHIYRVDRPGQVRGITWFAPVIVRLKDFTDYTDAQLLRQKIAACFGAFVTKQDGTGPSVDQNGNPLATDYAGFNIEGLEPGMVQYLREGEDISFPNPPQVADFDSYSKVTLHEIAAGLNVTYESLTTDLGEATYSGGRLGHLEYDRSIDSWIWNMLVPQMLEPIGGWTQDAINVVTGSTEPFSLEWTPPERILIDPATENEASKDAIRNGLSSRSEEARKRGFDPEQLDQEIAADNARADKLGLIFDSDARYVSTVGIAQPRVPVSMSSTTPATPAP